MKTLIFALLLSSNVFADYLRDDVPILYPHIREPGEWLGYCVFNKVTQDIQCLYKNSNECLKSLPIWKKMSPDPEDLVCVQREDTRPKLREVR